MGTLNIWWNSKIFSKQNYSFPSFKEKRPKQKNP